MKFISLRMKISVILGALLGLICILGAGFRFGFLGNSLHFLALWYNRFLMGVVIGMATSRKRRVALVRGALLGLIVSLAFYLTSGLEDHITFLVGGVYGIIIDYLSSRHSDFVNNIVNRLRGKNLGG
ncbi:hypothetical protein [Halarsenatibacter silvermanii]|uniref:Uncharacterized protein n=1 Tax=Halarsenatibacter silvermanii TaxID=321763 RepID=A0A1G9J710_9FIRM|nr:hypothetical protein [Halarsenatibacter silvermanii]SDL33131.1 hypothetical protein SAMN04488692_103152 [Halarsenatibacter silvermanii]